MTDFQTEKLHPLLEQGLNDEQKAAVLCMRNCVIAAGAGSGKTFVFARRFAHLIADKGFEADSILALTFTNKAASEMYERIYTTIKMLAASHQSGENDAAVLRAKKALEDFHKARIQTMDSYCAYLLRSASRLYGIRPDFSIDAQKIENFVLKEALSFTLKHRNEASLQRLCRLQSLDTIARDFFAKTVLSHSVFARPFNFDFFIEKQIQKIIDIWKKTLPIIEENTESLVLQQELADRLQKNAPSAKELFDYTLSMRDKSLPAEEKRRLSDVLSGRLTAFFSVLYNIQKIRLSEKNRAFVTPLRSAYASLSAAANYMLNFPDMLNLIPLLCEFEQSVREWKRRSGTLGFADVSSLALKILLEQPHIRRAEKKRIRCIMIDEFQDNNEDQRDMLFLLAEHPDRSEKSVPHPDELCPDKLFFVGDEKQSIYLFRGADVSVFKKLQRDLSGNGGFLQKNYRSSPALIDAYNTFFGGFAYPAGSGEKSPYSIFLQKGLIRSGSEFPLFEAEYVRALAGKNAKADSGADASEAPVHFYFLKKNGEDEEIDDDSVYTPLNDEYTGTDENEAAFIASKIASLIAEKKYRAQDIALLFRSYSRQNLYEKYLRLYGIPYTSETVAGFFSDAPVNDIYYFLRLIVYPQDEHAFAAVLTSPFVRLPLQAVPVCLKAVSASAASLSVFFCEYTGKDLRGNELYNFTEGLRLYEHIRSKSGTASCTDVLDELWYAAGYRYETLHAEEDLLFAELYDYLYEIARIADRDGQNLCGFVEALSRISVNSDRLQDTDIPLERADAVRLMSIHKSKGLEFPAVFICGVSARGRSAQNTEKLYADTEWGISFNFPPPKTIRDCGKNIFFDLIKDRIKQKAEAELRRLLYVAFTRAEREVYISASYAVNKEAAKILEKIQTEHADTVRSGVQLLKDELAAVFEAKLKKDTHAYSVTNPRYCIPNDSFFGFLLPVIAAYIGEEQNSPTNRTALPFTLEAIPLIRRSDIAKLSVSGGKTSGAKIFSELVPLYEKIPCTETPVLQSIYRSPSQLSAAQNGLETLTGNVSVDFPLQFVRQDLFCSYEEIDGIVHSFSDGTFGYNHFGTIAHAFTESALTGRPVKIPPESVYALNEKQKQTVFAAAKTMADNFIRSDLGQRAQSARWRKNEYAFKLLAEPPFSESGGSDTAAAKTSPVQNGRIILSGQIDLVFESDDGTLTVVDFKTDANECPADYILQLAVYRRAAAFIRNAEFSRVKTCLYYLRSGRTADISSLTETADPEAVLFGKNTAAALLL